MSAYSIPSAVACDRGSVELCIRHWSNGAEGLVRLNAQKSTRRHRCHLTIEFPHLNCNTSKTSRHVSIVGCINSVKDFGVGSGPWSLMYSSAPTAAGLPHWWGRQNEVARRADLVHPRSASGIRPIPCANCQLRVGREWRLVRRRFRSDALAGVSTTAMDALSPTGVRPPFLAGQAVMVVATPAGPYGVSP